MHFSESQLYIRCLAVYCCCYFVELIAGSILTVKWLLVPFGSEAGIGGGVI